MRIALTSLAAVALGCARVSENAGATTRGPEVSVPDLDAPQPTVETTPALPKCEMRGATPTRTPALSPPDSSARCHRVPSQLAKSLRAAVREAWMREWPSGRLEIGSGCDRLGDAIVSLDLELSSGHGGSLDLVRFHRTSGGDFSLLWIDYDHYAGRSSHDAKDPWQADMIGKYKVVRGTVPAATMATLLAHVRASAALDVVEHEPPPVKNGLAGRTIGGSSRDFGVALWLVDDDARAAEHFFAGYARIGEQQSRSVPLDLAVTPVRALLHDEAFAATLEPVDPAAPEVRELFAQRFWSARDRGEDFGFWYVRERYIALASMLGDHEHVPALLDPIGVTGDASVERTRVLAINAIAAITGFDRRYDANKSPRDPTTVASEVLVACKP